MSSEVSDRFDAVADELYGLRPDAFAAARDEHVKTARAANQSSLARELGRLRRPTQSAWLINLLWRDQRDVMEQLFEVAEGLSQAQAQASGTELHRLATQRRELETALIRRARTLAQEAGVTVSASMEREAQDTLSAALAQPEVAAEVRTGRLTRATSYAGFGTLPTTVPGFPAGARAQTTRETSTSTADESGLSASPPTKVDEIAQRAAERARRQREAAERRVQEARAQADDAAAVLTAQQNAAAAADQHQRDLARQLDDLRAQVRNLEAQGATAAQEAENVARHRAAAERAYEAAKHTLAQAEKALAELVKAG